MKIISENLAGGTFVALAEKQDAPLLKETEDICFDKSSWSLETFLETLENDSYRIYLLCDSQTSKMMGYSVMCYCLDEADLANIAVVPSMRKMGFGGALLDFILEESASLGVNAVYLEVRESNDSARQLYSSRGFEEIGKRKKYYRYPTEDAVLMVRKEQ